LKDDVGEAKGQILIVDDDLLNRFALKTLLQLCNFDVNSQSVLVENGVLAVNEVRNRGLKTFSLILMDVNMP
jgi:two-component system, sensor histidine kinase RetS